MLYTTCCSLVEMSAALFYQDFKDTFVCYTQLIAIEVKCR